MLSVFVMLNAVYYVLSEQAFGNYHSRISSTSVIVVAQATSLIVAVMASFWYERNLAISKICSWHRFWRFFGIALSFATSSFLVITAFRVGADSIMVATLGYLYLPASALFSTLAFGRIHRKYGQLEWLSLAIMTLAAFGFILLRERQKWSTSGAGATNSTVSDFGPDVFDTHTLPTVRDLLSVQGFTAARLEGAVLVCVAAAGSAAGSVFAERIYKGRARGISRFDGKTDAFAIQKVHLDLTSLLFSALVWLLQRPISVVFPALQTSEDWFGPWGWQQFAMVPVFIGQSWCAGLVCKKFSTVVKSIVQTISTIGVVCILDPMLGKYDFRVRAIPSLALALVLVLAAVIFQTGRINLSIIKRAKRRRIKGQAQLQESEKCGPSRAGSPKPPFLLRFQKYSLMFAYVLVYATQQLATQHILSNYLIVSATMNLMTFLFGVTLASFMTLMFYGKDGLRQAWDVHQIFQYLPIGILFGFSSAMLYVAYAHHVTASIVTVLGFIYMPVAALGKRIVLKQSTSWLQWVALTIITVASMTFGFLQAVAPSQRANEIQVVGLWFVIISATLAASASLVMEKMLGSTQQPFYIQKVGLDMGSIFTSVAMLFVHGWLSERPQDAFWRDRPLGQCNNEHCWGVRTDPYNNCAALACDCDCGSGVFVNWDSWLVWLTLCVITARQWFKGVVTKTTSTLEVAIAEAFTPIIIYFAGQPLVMCMEGMPGVMASLSNWALNCVVFITPLSAIVFTVAESKMRHVTELVDPKFLEDPECCPVHSLLVILSKLEAEEKEAIEEEECIGRERTGTTDWDGEEADYSER